MMDYSQILTLIGGVIGGGIGTAALNRYFDRRKDKASADRSEQDVRTASLANDAIEVQQILGYTKSLKDFVKETEENTNKISALTNRVSNLEREKDDLKRELQTKEAIIEYQKEERHEWTNSLMIVQEKYAESRLEIRSLQSRIASLEEVQEKETKLDLREPR